MKTINYIISKSNLFFEFSKKTSNIIINILYNIFIILYNELYICYNMVLDGNTDQIFMNRVRFCLFILHTYLFYLSFFEFFSNKYKIQCFYQHNNLTI